MALEDELSIAITWLCRLMAFHMVPYLYVSSRWKMEEVARRTIEILVGKKFPKARPRWLVNPITGRPLELDGYCEDLGLAFEYNGAQHYHRVPRFHSDDRDLEYQVYKDRLKRLLCLERGVHLIVIPYNVGLHEMCSFIESSVRRWRSNMLHIRP